MRPTASEGFASVARRESKVETKVGEAEVRTDGAAPDGNLCRSEHKVSG